MLGRKFPISERVTAGVSFKAMLKEVGVIGAAIIVGMIVRQIGDVFASSDLPVQIMARGWSWWLAYGAYVNFALGSADVHPVLMLIMIPLATTELGTDSWISPLDGAGDEQARPFWRAGFWSTPR